MKTFKYFLPTLACATLFACSGDDDNSSVDESLLVGEWNLEEYNYTSSTTITQGSETYSSSDVGEATSLDARVIFTNDTYQTEGSITFQVTTTMEGQPSISTVPMNAHDSGTYTLEGNKIKILNSVQREAGALAANEATVVELTANRMVWSIAETVTTEMEGMSLEIEIDGIQVFSR